MKKFQEKCINKECNNISYGTHYRCGRCRSARRLSCSNCGTELMSDNEIRCKECAYKHKRTVWNEKYRKNHPKRTYKSDMILEMLKDGATTKEMALRMNCTEGVVRSLVNYLRRYHTILLEQKTVVIQKYVLKSSQ